MSELLGGRTAQSKPIGISYFGTAFIIKAGRQKPRPPRAALTYQIDRAATRDDSHKDATRDDSHKDATRDDSHKDAARLTSLRLRTLMDARMLLSSRVHAGHGVAVQWLPEPDCLCLQSIGTLPASLNGRAPP
ncbi:Uncharacterized protein DAT39_021588 [Clarias magur]|uniref:Uncharacterized protein n=1 Tax=Clarias magur TaxID=1594786 RepID=A0A8J4WQL6_CLAMG|nr:Uncharacterized protein DAT39_021588 [Clarias magur]